MDAPAARTGPASVGRRRFARDDLLLATLVLAFCVCDTTANTFGEAAFFPKATDWPQRLWHNFEGSLLGIGSGWLAVWLVMPGYPTSFRRCAQMVAVFLVGSAVGHWFVIRWFTPWPNPTIAWVASLIAQSLSSVGVGFASIVASMYWWRRGSLIQQELHRTRIDLLSMQADRADAELLRLRTQIEPHFLFNTIANIVQMYQTDAAAAGRTLARLIGYMDTSHAHIRRQEAALDEELALTEGYLEIQRMRMGTRLRYEIDVSSDLHRTGIPPAALLTLVENAIKHGLAPQTMGGTVRVSAHRDGESLVLSVADDGVGLRATSGRGLGLANVRARIEGLYGSAASLRLASAEQGGAVATIRLPFGPPRSGTVA